MRCVGGRVGLSRAGKTVPETQLQQGPQPFLWGSSGAGFSSSVVLGEGCGISGHSHLPVNGKGLPLKRTHDAG